MKVLINRSEINGKVTAPSSKSYTIRSLICAAIAKGRSKIINPLVADDTEAASEALKKVGIDIQKKDTSWEISGGCFHAPEGDIFCRDSAATIRFMTALASIIPGECRLVPGTSLARRPIQPLIKALQELDVNCRLEGTTVVVDGGRLGGGTVSFPGDISSQYVSALLFLSPLAEAGLNICLTTPPESSPYIKMTLDCLEQFGIDVVASPTLQFFAGYRQNYKPAEYVVEGDWSSASYLMALGAIAGNIEITNLNLNSLQGDRLVLKLLNRMGAIIQNQKDSVIASRSVLKAVNADLSDCIDLLPTMAALAAIAEGKSYFYGIKRARIKESNRVRAVKQGLERMRIPVVEEEDELIITGGKPESATVDSFGDHRIAMAFSMLGIIAGNTIISGSECVSKTYPQFWNILESLGGKVDYNVQ
ncbi:MAG: 3-phosphoshikimate 1-carboxyvinyltransferase [Dehalococcoidales bacterium]|nr:3-phosphoshikimate 1-carboxyvinyltransferase [Dehalococcoidales bacterium]